MAGKMTFETKRRIKNWFWIAVMAGWSAVLIYAFYRFCQAVLVLLEN